MPWVFVLAFLVGIGLDRLLPSSIHEGRWAPVRIVGAVIFIAGALVAFTAHRLFTRARTTTTPGEMPSTFVIRGPYRITRNPMYVGLVLAYIGEAGMVAEFWPLLFLPLVIAYLDRIVIPVEEADLRQIFGIEYQRYCSSVRRWV